MLKRRLARLERKVDWLYLVATIRECYRQRPSSTPLPTDLQMEVLLSVERVARIEALAQRTDVGGVATNTLARAYGIGDTAAWVRWHAQEPREGVSSEDDIAYMHAEPRVADNKDLVRLGTARVTKRRRIGGGSGLAGC